MHTITLACVVGICVLGVECGARDAMHLCGATPLLVASQSGHLQVVCLLSDARASKDIALQGGATPLPVASQQGHQEVVCRPMQRKAERCIASLAQH